MSSAITDPNHTPQPRPGSSTFTAGRPTRMDGAELVGATAGSLAGQEYQEG